MAENYPATPNADTVAHCEQFVQAIPYMLPCSHCGYNFQTFLDDYQPEICTDKPALVQFLVDAHNNVSHHTNPQRAPWTVAQAHDTYSTEQACFHNTAWGHHELNRDAVLRPVPARRSSAGRSAAAAAAAAAFGSATSSGAPR